MTYFLSHSERSHSCTSAMATKEADVAAVEEFLKKYPASSASPVGPGALLKIPGATNFWNKMYARRCAPPPVWR